MAKHDPSSVGDAYRFGRTYGSKPNNDDPYPRLKNSDSGTGKVAQTI
jgi:hypothetical protein